MIEAHQGSLEAASEGLNRGAKFTARFQADDSPFRQRLESHESSLNLAAGLRILLVEDNADTRECVGALLASEGYHVRTAGDTRTALELNRTHNFDLLITDLGLPDGSGRDLLQKMRVTAPYLEGIAITGYGAAQDILKTKAAGYLVHLVKPVAFPKLLLAIRTLYRQAREATRSQMWA